MCRPFDRWTPSRKVSDFNRPRSQPKIVAGVGSCGGTSRTDSSNIWQSSISLNTNRPAVLCVSRLPSCFSNVNRIAAFSSPLPANSEIGTVHSKTASAQSDAAHKMANRSYRGVRRAPRVAFQICVRAFSEGFGCENDHRGQTHGGSFSPNAEAAEVITEPALHASRSRRESRRHPSTRISVGRRIHNRNAQSSAI